MKKKSAQEPYAHYVERMTRVHARRLFQRRAPVPDVKSFTLNPRLADAEVRAYFVGLLLASLPEAVYGPDEHDTTPYQRNLRNKVEELTKEWRARGGSGTGVADDGFTEFVLRHIRDVPSD